jgi:hypothetical protein
MLDYLGGFQRDVFYQYVYKVTHKGDFIDIIDIKKSGAGLGVYKILYHSQSFICNVKPGVKTEIMAFLQTKPCFRDFKKASKSVHFFIEK